MAPLRLIRQLRVLRRQQRLRPPRQLSLSQRLPIAPLQHPLSQRLLMRRQRSPRLEYQLSRALNGLKSEGLIVGPRQRVNSRYGMD